MKQIHLKHYLITTHQKKIIFFFLGWYRFSWGRNHQIWRLCSISWCSCISEDLSISLKHFPTLHVIKKQNLKRHFFFSSFLYNSSVYTLSLSRISRNVNLKWHITCQIPRQLIKLSFISFMPELVIRTF